LLFAVFLFAVGLVEGWHYRVTALMASSILVSAAWLVLWAFVWTTHDVGKVLLLFADLAAHQAGYLVGAYLGSGADDDR
jgi:hypothetical protein